MRTATVKARAFLRHNRRTAHIPSARSDGRVRIVHRPAMRSGKQYPAPLFGGPLPINLAYIAAGFIVAVGSSLVMTYLF